MEAPVALRIRVAEDAGLQQLVVRGQQARRHVAGVKGDHLVVVEPVVNISVQRHHPHLPQGELVLHRPQPLQRELQRTLMWHLQKTEM